MVKIELKEGQDAYNEVSKYVENYCKHNFYDDCLCKIGLSYDGVDFDIMNELTLIDDGTDFIWENDWWEGQKHIILYSVIAVSEIKIQDGTGIYLD